MELIVFILLTAAAVCFVLAAFGVGARINLVAAGLFCWVMTVWLAAVQNL